MKDTILKIIFNHIGNVVESTPHYQSASEIAEMMTAFHVWYVWQQDFFPQIVGLETQYFDYYGKVRKNECIIFNELFTYWHTEIYKK